MRFSSPLGAVKVGRVNGNFIINPTYAQSKESEMEIVSFTGGGRFATK